MAEQQASIAHMITGVMGWVQDTRPVRAFMRYLNNRGPLMAAGMTYNALFSVFAAIWIGFSVLGIVVSRNSEVWEQTVAFVAISVPGLIDTGDGGVIDPNTLANTSLVLSWTGIVALLSLLFTMLGWLRGARSGVRGVFELPQLKEQAVKVQLRDFGLALAYGLLVLISAGVSLFTTQLGNLLTDWLGITASAGILGVRGGTLLVSIALDLVALVATIRVLAKVEITVKQLWRGALVGAIAMTGLKVLGTALVGGAASNPLLASFAAIIGVLLWLNLLSQTILIASSLIAESAAEPRRPFWGSQTPRERIDEAARGSRAKTT